MTTQYISPPADLSQAHIDNVARACWQLDHDSNSPPPIATSEIPMPNSRLYAKNEWREAQRRALALLGLQRKPRRSLARLMQDIQAAQNGNAPKRRARRGSPLSAADSDKIEAFIMCDDPAADAAVWLYALEWTLTLYPQIAAIRGDQPKHPIAPLVRAMQSTRSVAMPPSRIANGIIPSTMHAARALGYLPELPADNYAQPGPQQPSLLPNFNPPPSLVIPTDMIYTAPQETAPDRQRGRAAPIPKRIFFEILTAIPKEGRALDEVWQMACTLRDLKEWLYPPTAASRSNFNMKRHLQIIRHALFEVGNIRMQRTLPGAKAPTDWLPIAVRALPTADLDSPVIFDIRLPPGSSGGALIDRQAMRHYGRISALQYSAALGFAYYWDMYGTHKGNRLLATKPKIAANAQGHALDAQGRVILNKQGHPISGYTDPRIVFLTEDNSPALGRTLGERRAAAARERNTEAQRRFPPLSNIDILTLCYPEEAGTLAETKYRRQKLARAKDAIRQMANDDYCIIEETEISETETGWRVLPQDPQAFAR